MTVAMLHYPKIQKKAQAELDAVVGWERMPEYEDRENLPYIRALINETLRYYFSYKLPSYFFFFNLMAHKLHDRRWRPVAILGGTPHAVTADDVYNGM